MDNYRYEIQRDGTCSFLSHQHFLREKLNTMQRCMSELSYHLKQLNINPETSYPSCDFRSREETAVHKMKMLWLRYLSPFVLTKYEDNFFRVVQMALDHYQSTHIRVSALDMPRRYAIQHLFWFPHMSSMQNMPLSSVQREQRDVPEPSNTDTRLSPLQNIAPLKAVSSNAPHVNQSSMPATAKSKEKLIKQGDETRQKVIAVLDALIERANELWREIICVPVGQPADGEASSSVDEAFKLSILRAKNLFLAFEVCIKKEHEQLMRDLDMAQAQYIKDLMTTQHYKAQLHYYGNVLQQHISHHLSKASADKQRYKTNINKTWSIYSITDFQQKQFFDPLHERSLQSVQDAISSDAKSANQQAVLSSNGKITIASLLSEDNTHPPHYDSSRP